MQERFVRKKSLGENAKLRQMLKTGEELPSLPLARASLPTGEKWQTMPVLHIA
jgi:hypothetical protein